ncbi:MAG TPA: adenylate/guanylate cyclase domain-containing protein [Candidatus Eremiobacteraceae bacterium]|nr:adenylate/guanylate cyclase domain-containing protein [Candidatus Eremiobacteraceae bacterium]
MPPEAERQAQGSVAMPTGTVTFLFSDIEGSTQRWERHQDAMRTAVARHEQIVNEAVTRHGGFVFKTLGDAFCVAFATAPQAVGAAIDAQRALAEEDFELVDGLRVRIGLHTGHAEERNTDYFGPTVNRVARLMSIGHGGQVLLSATTRDLAHADLPKDTSLVDLGSHRLKDLTEPEHVWQLNGHGLPSEFPSLRSLNALPHNLPIKRTTFVGRERDVADVKDLLARHHLLTLAGSGGVGKTRLAVQAGAEILDRFPDGVWFVDLAPISDAELVASVTSQVLGISQKVGNRVDESIPPWLEHKKLLLIFDNCEHVLETVAALAVSILRAAPDVRILSTSRQVLGIGDEEVLRLRSLEVPHQTDVTPSKVLEFGSVGLFVDRARSVDKSFALTDNTAPIVADICRRLDGIPLAIELAAARVKVLSIPNLAKRLDERFKVLTGGSREVLPRQKTLSALIDWSYDLLDPKEQLLFRNLGIFAGGFGLEAATSVCGAEGSDEIDVLDLLASLTDKSLVIADTSGEHERYHLLESTRAYALDKLTASNQRDRMARRHAEFFRDKAQATAERYNTEFFSWPAEVELDLDDYRGALEWTLTQGNDATVGGTIAGQLSSMWRRGLAVEGRYWILLALERVDESEQPWVAARLWHALGVQSAGKQKLEAAERAVRLFESVGDVRWAGYARISLGRALLDMGRYEEASQEYSRALSAVRASGDRLRAAICLHALASVEWMVGDRGRAGDLFAESLAAHQACGDEEGTAQVQADMAEFEFAEGHPDQALRLASRAAETLRGKNARSSSFIHVNIAVYHIALGDSNGGRQSAREGLHLARQARVEQSIANGLQHLALISALRGESGPAAQLLGYVDAQNKLLGLERQFTEKWSYERLTAALRDKLGDAEIAAFAAEGVAWSEDQAFEEALKV